jgi:hypothetical protein
MIAHRIQKLTGQAFGGGLRNVFVLAEDGVGTMGFFWTGHGEKYRDEVERWRNEPLDSYYGRDCTSWEFIQQDRDEELRIDASTGTFRNKPR